MQHHQQYRQHGMHPQAMQNLHHQQHPPHPQRVRGPGQMIPPHAQGMAHVQHAQVQQQQQQQNEANRLRAEAASRRSKSPSLRDLPEGVEEVIHFPELIDTFKRVREADKQVDEFFLRKKRQYEDPKQFTTQIKKTMEVRITNTVKDQYWQLAPDEFDFNDAGQVATWKLRIRGLILRDKYDDVNDENDKQDEVMFKGWEDLLSKDPMDTIAADVDRAKGDPLSQGNAAGKDGAEPQQAAGSNDRAAQQQTSSSADQAHVGATSNGDAKPESQEPPKREKYVVPFGNRNKMAHFYKRITVELDPEFHPEADGSLIADWNKPPEDPNALKKNPERNWQEFTVERRGDQNQHIIIKFYRDETPQKFAMSPELQWIVDEPEATREHIVWSLHTYCKTCNLFADNEQRTVQCDDELKRVFKRDTLYFPDVSQLIIEHLKEIEPYQVKYTIHIDEDFHTKTPNVEMVYNFTVRPENAIKARLRKIVTDTRYVQLAQKIKGLDSQVMHLILGLQHCMARWKFFKEMSEDPVMFLRKWVDSQKRDLDLYMGGGPRSVGDDTFIGDEYRRGGEDSIWNSDLVREAAQLIARRDPKAVVERQG